MSNLFGLFQRQKTLHKVPVFVKNFIKLDPDLHGEEQLDPQKMNADPQPCSEIIIKKVLKSEISIAYTRAADGKTNFIHKTPKN